MSKSQATNHVPKIRLHIGYWDWECMFSKFIGNEDRRERRIFLPSFLPSSTYPKLSRQKFSNRARYPEPSHIHGCTPVCLLVPVPSSLSCTDPTQACCLTAPWNEASQLFEILLTGCSYLPPAFNGPLVHIVLSPFLITGLTLIRG